MTNFYISMRKINPTITLSSDKKWLSFLLVSILLMLGILLINCGDSSAGNISKSLTPHAAITLDGGTAVESNLAITSDSSPAAIFITNGGSLTLNDSSIIKTTSTGSANNNQPPSSSGQQGASLSQSGASKGQGGGSSNSKIKLDVTPFFAVVDTNKDNRISKDEWKAAGLDEIVFEKFDTNKKGSFSKEEMANTTHPPEIDSNKDGKLTLEKLKAHLKNQMQHDPGHGNKPPGDSISDNPPVGDPPSGATPTGQPPSGNPPTGNPPSGNPPANSNAAGTGAGDNNTTSDSDKRSGVYVGSRGKLILSNITIDTKLTRGKGLSADGNGSSITMTKGTITTTGSSSHGVFVFNGAAASLKDVVLTTKGEHSSAIATDTGGGTIIVEGGSYTASGKYSAGIYSTGDISVSGATLKSEMDYAAICENGSKINLINTSLWSVKKGGVMMYQGDSTTGGRSEFKMTGGKIQVEEGPVFYVNCTNATIVLKNVELPDHSGIVVKVLKGYQGSDIASSVPSNKGAVNFITDGETISGDIVMDENSSINMTLNNKSKLKGAINTDNKGKEINLKLDASSAWDVTDDSNLSAIELKGGISGDIIPNITGNGHNIYYDKGVSNKILDGKTYNLAKGGKLLPK
jgi:hypothetical protein